jgi:hypothetical protein
MFIPPTFHAETLNFSDAQLDGPQKCLCGNDVKLRDCVVCWTHHPESNDYGWFAACHGQCITAQVTEGSA